jgi:hypothetical protein
MLQKAVVVNLVTKKQDGFAFKNKLCTECDVQLTKNDWDRMTTVCQADGTLRLGSMTWRWTRLKTKTFVFYHVIAV